MTDKELLEYAAKAAGIDKTNIGDDRYFWLYNNDIGMFRTDYQHSKIYETWNPLTDDGDALRLAVKLDIEIGRSFNNSWWAKHYVSNDVFNESTEREDGLMDSGAATRRAIVRAAAQIGKEMP